MKSLPSDELAALLALRTAVESQVRVAANDEEVLEQVHQSHHLRGEIARDRGRSRQIAADRGRSHEIAADRTRSRQIARDRGRSRRIARDRARSREIGHT